MGVFVSLGKFLTPKTTYATLCVTTHVTTSEATITLSHVPGDKFLDCITLGGVKGVPVLQEGGHNAFIEMSRTVNRSASLYAFDFPTKITRRRLWMLDEIPVGLVWCSGCGDWHLPSDFSPDKRNRNGLHSHCKTCRNKHRQIMYAKQKYDGAFLKKTIGQGSYPN